MLHTLVQDVETAIDRVESDLYDLRHDDLESAIGHLDDADTNLEEVRNELRYVNDEMEEMQEAVDQCEEIECRFGSSDPDDWEVCNEDELQDLIRERDEAIAELKELKLSNDEKAREKMAHVIIGQANLIIRMRNILGLIGGMASETNEWSIHDEPQTCLPAPADVVENFDEQAKGDSDATV